MAKKHITMPQGIEAGATTWFYKNENELSQYLRMRKPQKSEEHPDYPDFDLPLEKALRGSITFQRDPSVKNGKYIHQVIRVYRKTATKKSAPIYETKYARVSVSKSRVTVSLSFPLCDDPDRLKARLQNFANIIIDESDEIAAVLNQEGDTKVQEAWQQLAQPNAIDN